MSFSEKIDQSSEKEKEDKSIVVYHQRRTKSDETFFDSDEMSELRDSNSDLFDLEIREHSKHDDVNEKFKKKMQMKRKSALQKLQVVKLDNISIPPSISQAQHIVNLRQSFTFPVALKPSREIATQTSQLNLTSTCDNSLQRNLLKRPASLPPENVALTNLQKRVGAEVNSNNFDQNIGDGLNNAREPEQIANGIRAPDLELAGCIPQSGVKSVLVKSIREPTPKFNCKKVPRPQTKYVRRPQDNLLEKQSQSSSNSSDDVRCKADFLEFTRKGAKPKESENVNRSLLTKKPENLLHYEMSSDVSTDAGLNTNGNNYGKLCKVVDKLQDPEWEICIDGLRGFQELSNTLDWESELGQKFIPIISRKLIDFFKSPRSNLCRTACQTAGDFFAKAKSTKRPEFDEMIDILLCKSADPNRFIQKDANQALFSMAMNICVHHSIRALCSKGPEHKNSIVRATTARLLYIICKEAGNEQIVGADSNPRTRKRVVTNLAKFLMDKNQDTRRNAEKLCRLLKRHKFFQEYFFKDIENNQKIPLRKILNALE